MNLGEISINGVYSTLQFVALLIELTLFFGILLYAYMYYSVCKKVVQWLGPQKISILSISLIFIEFQGIVLRKIFKKDEFNGHIQDTKQAYLETIKLLDEPIVEGQESVEELISLENKLIFFLNNEFPADLSKWFYPLIQQQAYRQWLLSAIHFVRALKTVRQMERLKEAAAKARSEQASISWREILGISHSEKNFEVIKSAYRRLAAKTHPDRGGDADKFKEISLAYKMAKKELS